VSFWKDGAEGLMIIEIINGEAFVECIGSDVVVRNYDIKAGDDYELDEDGMPCIEYVAQN